MKLFNSFTGKQEIFNPNDPRNITIYICGPTVYDDAHLGHARTYVTFDLIRRILGILNYGSMVVMNITDVDDKIINRSLERNISPSELAQTYELRFLQDMELLNVSEPDILTHVTDYIQEIINFIQDLITKGYAYEKDGDVKFNLSKYNGTFTYPGFKLCNIDNEEEQNDFTLWKGNKEGLSWDSPWGYGKSTMSTCIFGSELDIHVGGVDLAFPHHANEIAQTQAKFQDNWVSMFLHTGHLSIKGRKMAKSLKNFITIRDALREYDPHILRMYFASHKYNAPMNFSADELERAKKTWDTFNSFWRKITGLPS